MHSFPRTMTRRRAIAPLTAALLAAVLVTAGCTGWPPGGSDPSEGSDRPGTTTATPAPSTPTTTRETGPPAWHLTEPPPTEPTSVLRDVVAVDATHAWAVGVDEYTPTQPDTSGVPMIAKWDGSRWSRVPLPGITWHGGLSHVAATSATDVWAVGGSAGPDLDDTITRVLHYDGTGWREVPFPLGNTPSTMQTTDLAVAGGHPWIIGNNISETVIQEWDGQSWRAHQPPAECLGSGTSFGGMPTFCNFTAITALAPDDIWACGNAAWPGFQGPALYHWDGDRWHAVKAGPNQSMSALTAITARTPTDIWAIGDNVMQGGGTIAVHGDGTSWQLVDGLPLARIAAVAQDADGRPWVVENFPAPSSTLATYINGSWVNTPAPTPPDTVGITVYGITAVPGTTRMLAVGAADLPTDPRLLQAVTLEYSNRST